MSRIAIPAVATATGATADVYAEVRKIAGGTVPNLFAALGHLVPNALSAVLNAEGVLANGSLSKQDLETIKLLVSELTGCDYCVAAHVMLGKMTGLPSQVLTQIRQGASTGGQQARCPGQLRTEAAENQRHPERCRCCCDPPGGLQRCATGGNLADDRADHLHQYLQPHQRHRHRHAACEVNCAGIRTLQCTNKERGLRASFAFFTRLLLKPW